MVEDRIAPEDKPNLPASETAIETAVDLNALAQAVLVLMKRELRIERERRRSKVYSGK